MQTLPQKLQVQQQRYSLEGIKHTNETLEGSLYTFSLEYLAVFTFETKLKDQRNLLPFFISHSLNLFHYPLSGPVPGFKLPDPK